MPDTPTLAPAFVSADVVAQTLGISKATIYRLVDEGTCPIQPVRIGEKLIRFRRSDLDAFVAGASS